MTTFYEDEFYAALLDGSSREDAAVLSGLPLRLLEEWHRLGEQGEEPFITFLENCRRCEAQYKRRLGRTVRRVAEGSEDEEAKPNWSAAAFLLERRFAPEFGRVNEDKVHADIMRTLGALQTALKSIVLRYVPEEEREACAEELEAAFNEGAT